MEVFVSIILALLIYLTIGLFASGLYGEFNLGAVLFWPILVVGVIFFVLAAAPYRFGKWLHNLFKKKGED